MEEYLIPAEDIKLGTRWAERSQGSWTFAFQRQEGSGSRH